MMTDLTISFNVPSWRKMHVWIYEGYDFKKWQTSTSLGWPRQYSVPAYVGKIPADIAKRLDLKKSKLDDGKLYALVRSQRRPEVLVDKCDLDRLVRELQYLDARNLPRDKIFEGRDITATATAFEASEETMALIRRRYPEAPHAEPTLFLNLKSVSICL